jgi:hypothetical protein
MLCLTFTSLADFQSVLDIKILEESKTYECYLVWAARKSSISISLEA